MTASTRAYRAARYFGLLDKPRTSVAYHDGIAPCVAVIAEDKHPNGKTMICLYREYPRIDGWVLMLTAKQLAAFKEALGGSGA